MTFWQKILYSLGLYTPPVVQAPKPQPVSPASPAVNPNANTVGSATSPSAAPSVPSASAPMKMSDAGLAMCIYYECGDKGPDLVAYQDSVGVWTYGIGAIVKPDGSSVRQGDTISKEAAEALFLQQVDSEGGHYVRSWAGSLVSNQQQFDACADFCYNRGAGRLRDLLAKSHTQQELADNILLWDWAGPPDNHLLGLQRRRRSEREMFLGGDWTKWKEWEPS